MRRLLAVFLFVLTMAPCAWSQDIVIGQSVPLSGSNADIGRDMRDGALAVFAKVNASNELGRKVQLVTLDNANNRQRATENTQQLLSQHGALVLFGYNSATTSIDSLASGGAEQHAVLRALQRLASLRSHPTSSRSARPTATRRQDPGSQALRRCRQGGRAALRRRGGPQQLRGGGGAYTDAGAARPRAWASSAARRWMRPRSTRC